MVELSESEFYLFHNNTIVVTIDEICSTGHSMSWFMLSTEVRDTGGGPRSAVVCWAEAEDSHRARPGPQPQDPTPGRGDVSAGLADRECCPGGTGESHGGQDYHRHRTQTFHRQAR